MKEKKIDRTLLDLCIGILFWGMICQGTGMWFVRDSAAFSIGLWIGVLTAAAAGIHMWWALNKALDFTQSTAVKVMVKHNIIRYTLIVAVMGVVMITEAGNPLAVFLGIIGLKVSAYIQPLTNKICSRFMK